VARTQTSAPTHAPAQVGLSREAVAGVTRPPVPPIPEQAFSYGEQQHADCGQRSIEDRIEEAKAAADREDFEHALSLLDSLRQETPFDPRVHRLLGEIHLQLSDPRAASYSFARLLYLDPGNAAAHWRMADAAEQMGRHDVELRHLGNALKCLQNSASLEQLELPRDVLVKACLHRIERLRLKERT
jgi:predicted Zn-dependent protease